MLIRTIRYGDAGRWPLRGAAVAILLACAGSLGRAAEPVRLALIGDASLAAVRSFQAILEAELVGLPGAALLERGEIQRVIVEQKLTGLFDAEQAIRVGRLLPADVFVWIECGPKAEHPDGLVIYDAHTGVRYVDAPLPEQSPQTVARVAVAEALVKRGAAAHRPLTLGIISIRNADLPRQMDTMCDAVGLLLERELLRSPQVCVLERRRLVAVNQERAVSQASAALLGSVQMIDLEIARSGEKGLQATVRLIAPDGSKGEPIGVKQDGTTPGTLARSLAAGLLESIKTTPAAAAVPADRQREAARYYAEARQLLELKQYARMAESAEAACALAPESGEYAGFLSYGLMEWARCEVVPLFEQKNRGNGITSRQIQDAATPALRAVEIRRSLVPASDKASADDIYTEGGWREEFNRSRSQLLQIMRRVEFIDGFEVYWDADNALIRARFSVLHGLVQRDPAHLPAYRNILFSELHVAPVFEKSSALCGEVVRKNLACAQPFVALVEQRKRDGKLDESGVAAAQLVEFVAWPATWNNVVLPESVLTPLNAWLSSLSSSPVAAFRDEAAWARLKLQQASRVSGTTTSDHVASLVTRIKKSVSVPGGKLDGEAVEQLKRIIPTFGGPDAQKTQLWLWETLLDYGQLASDSINFQMGHADRAGAPELQAETRRLIRKTLKVMAEGKIKDDPWHTAWFTPRMEAILNESIPARWQDAKLLYTVPGDGYLLRAALVDSDRAYFLQSQWKNRKIHYAAGIVLLKTGEVRWLATIRDDFQDPANQNRVWHQLAVLNDTLFVNSQSTGLLAFPLDGSPGWRVDSSTGLPSDQARGLATADGMVYAALGGGFIVRYDPAKRQVKVLASSTRQERQSPLDGQGRFDCELMIPDPPRHRILFPVSGVGAMAAHNGIWSLDTRDLSMRRVVGLGEPVGFWGLTASDGNTVVLGSARFAAARLDMEGDRWEVLISRKGDSLPPGEAPTRFVTVDGFGVACVPVNGELWSAFGWHRLATSSPIAHALPRLPGIPEGQEGRPYANQLLPFDGGRGILVVGSRSLWALRFDRPIDMRLPEVPSTTQPATRP